MEFELCFSFNQQSKSDSAKRDENKKKTKKNLVRRDDERLEWAQSSTRFVSWAWAEYYEWVAACTVKWKWDKRNGVRSFPKYSELSSIERQRWRSGHIYKYGRDWPLSCTSKIQLQLNKYPRENIQIKVESVFIFICPQTATTATTRWWRRPSRRRWVWRLHIKPLHRGREEVER